MMYDIKKIVNKVNRKNGFYRVLGKRERDADITNDPEIFEERDVANDLLHELMSTILDLGEGAGDQDVMMNNTARIIQERLLMRKKKNNVDRKASKDRKLKFDFHEKLINFMSSYENLDETEDRDQFINNLFGVSSKKLKTSKKNIEKNENEESDDSGVSDSEEKSSVMEEEQENDIELF